MCKAHASPVFFMSVLGKVLFMVVAWGPWAVEPQHLPTPALDFRDPGTVLSTPDAQRLLKFLPQAWCQQGLPLRQIPSLHTFGSRCPLQRCTSVCLNCTSPDYLGLTYTTGVNQRGRNHIGSVLLSSSISKPKVLIWLSSCISQWKTTFLQRNFKHYTIFTMLTSVLWKDTESQTGKLQRRIILFLQK